MAIRMLTSSVGTPAADNRDYCADKKPPPPLKVPLMSGLRCSLKQLLQLVVVVNMLLAALDV